MKFDCNMYIHPTQARGLTPREAARVQSYPDDYFFRGAYTKTYMQIGNSVPPLLGRAIAQVIKEYTNMDISQLPGAGAAGGMGGGLLPFLNAELQSGIEVILKTLRFEEVVRQADLILTGEGKLDRQTGMGKALDGILRVGEKCQVPVIALGGAVEATA